MFLILFGDVTLVAELPPLTDKEPDKTGLLISPLPTEIARNFPVDCWVDSVIIWRSFTGGVLTDTVRNLPPAAVVGWSVVAEVLEPNMEARSRTFTLSSIAP